MNQRSAMIEAHEQAALCLRQHVNSAINGVMEDPADSDKVSTAIEELAQRHDRAAQRLRSSGSYPATGGQP